MNKEDIINLVETIGKLSKENTNLYGILINIVKELSVIYPNHEIETLPAKVKEVVQRLTEVEEECRLREQWEELSDNLIVHAQNLKGSSLMWGHEEWYEDISEDIIQYKKLKDLTDGN